MDGWKRWNRRGSSAVAGSDGPAGMRRQSAQGLFCTDEKRWAFASKEERAYAAKRSRRKHSPSTVRGGYQRQFLIWHRSGTTETGCQAAIFPAIGRGRLSRRQPADSKTARGLWSSGGSPEPDAAGWGWGGAVGRPDSRRREKPRRGGQPTENSAFAFSIVAAAICSIGSVRTEASASSVRKVRRGSLRLPRNGSGVI